MSNRAEAIALGSYVHVCNRGARKLLIYRQKSDLWRLVFNLFYLNSVYVPENWSRQLEERAPDAISRFLWLPEWGEKVPLVSILSYSIMPNHFHLLLKETVEGGISKFMHKFSMSYAKFINIKYHESGSLFQGRFRSRTISGDEYFRYVATYIMVKNPMELYPNGGIGGAVKDFESAWHWAIQHPFSSLPEYAGTRKSCVIKKELLGEIFKTPKEFKDFSRDFILGRVLDIDNVADL